MTITFIFITEQVQGVWEPSVALAVLLSLSSDGADD